MKYLYLLMCIVFVSCTSNKNGEIKSKESISCETDSIPDYIIVGNQQCIIVSDYYNKEEGEYRHFLHYRANCNNGENIRYEVGYPDEDISWRYKPCGRCVPKDSIYSFIMRLSDMIDITFTRE